MSSNVGDVAYWFEQQPFRDLAAKSKIIDLIRAEAVNGAEFCRRIVRVEDLETQFGVELTISDRALLRRALQQ